MAELSKDLGLTEQAVYCLTKVIRADKDALDARLERASLYAQLGNLREVRQWGWGWGGRVGTYRFLLSSDCAHLSCRK
jgi:hypothetical protein